MRVFTWKSAVVMGLSSAGLASSLAWAQAQQSDSPFDQQPEARLACERLKTQIDQTIRDNGARHFLLEIVDNAQVDDDVVREGEAFAGAEVVGSCDGGTRKIVYSRDGATEMSATPPREEASTTDASGSAANGDGSSLPETTPTAPESMGQDAVPTRQPENGEAGQEPESSP
ncbi:DUF1161 domain-containing protein [uncultured Salinicola sp.]|uniref:DUF1161 domain-containing protein n=1 Tax=uncultured Salinicola sp. TaxID=1193542 RepID=UPI0026164FE7|nr:DUF1161 domain-containing protein [uncultured Salinicola sp.]